MATHSSTGVFGREECWAIVGGEGLLPLPAGVLFKACYLVWLHKTICSFTLSPSLSLQQRNKKGHNSRVSWCRWSFLIIIVFITPLTSHQPMDGNQKLFALNNTAIGLRWQLCQCVYNCAAELISSLFPQCLTSLSHADNSCLALQHIHINMKLLDQNASWEVILKLSVLTNNTNLIWKETNAMPVHEIYKSC